MTLEYPQDGGWGELLVRLPHLHGAQRLVPNIRLMHMQNDYTHKMAAAGKGLTTSIWAFLLSGISALN